ncbi:Rv3654c family TadE-like protein [Streptomyces sparsogenes]|uniref:Rv3654c family TadE-like protein n=1 Tax=Streptomyces sparsogenes TaxID=67365 RepID=UPI00340784B0
MRRAGGDRGSATVWTALTATALCAVFAAVLAAGQIMVARHRAGAAADLAALAAADHGLEGAEAACGLARRVAAAQGTRVVRCALRGAVADLRVAARAGPFAPEVRARAAPVDPAGAVPPAADPPGAVPPAADPPGAVPPAADPPGADPAAADPAGAVPPAADPTAADPAGAVPSAADPAGPAALPGSAGRVGAPAR